MRTVNRWGKTPAQIRLGEKVIERSIPFPEIATEVASFQPEQERYKDAYQAVLDARRACRVAVGELHRAEKVLDNEKRTLGFALFSAELGRRNSENYHSYFPRGFGATLGIPRSQSLALTAGLIAALETEPNPDIAARRERLRRAYEELAAALARRQEAEDHLGRMKSLLEEQGPVWREAFNMFAFTLRARFPDRRAWIDSLFQAPGRRESAAEEAAEEDGEGRVAPALEPAAGEVEPGTGDPFVGEEAAA